MIGCRYRYSIRSGWTPNLIDRLIAISRSGLELNRAMRPVQCWSFRFLIAKFINQSEHMIKIRIERILIEICIFFYNSVQISYQNNENFFFLEGPWELGELFGFIKSAFLKRSKKFYIAKIGSLIGLHNFVSQ